MHHVHGGDLVTFHQLYPGLPVLDFSANINPLGLPPAAKAVWEDCREDCMSYPDPHCRALCQAIAGYEGVFPHWVLCGNGASDLITRIAWVFRPRRALLLSPTFADYQRALEPTGCQLDYWDLWEQDGFAPSPGILGAVDRADLVFLCNPNNPTGVVMDPPLLDQIALRCHERRIPLVVDECFLDFLPDSGRHTVKRHLGAIPRLIVLRAFTKIFAMPGLRLGYALCSDRSVLERLEAVGPGWSVSAPAQRCGVAAVGERAYIAQTRRLVPAWRRELAQGLESLGCQVIPGAANYLFFRAEEGLAAALAPRGILLRDCANYRGIRPGWYRTAVRDKHDNHKLLQAMQEVTGQKGAF